MRPRSRCHTAHKKNCRGVTLVAVSQTVGVTDGRGVTFFFLAAVSHNGRGVTKVRFFGRGVTHGRWAVLEKTIADERTVGAKFMLTRSAQAFAMMCPTLLLRLLKKAARLEKTAS
jgi:hypothetical protein